MIYKFAEYIKENVNNIIFVRNKKFDNSNTVRELPYKGIHCWAIYENDFDKYVDELELFGGNKKNVEIINTIGYDIFALDYQKAHKYVVGESKIVPELETFDKNIHCLKFIKQGKKSMLEYSSNLLLNKTAYQILLMK